MKTVKFFINNNHSDSIKTLILFTDWSEELLKSIQKEIHEPLCIISFTDVDWNRDFSPWPYDKFTGEGIKTIEEALSQSEGEVCVAGYSLGGLLACVSMTVSERIIACASVSGSLWYPGFIEYLKENTVSERNVYLSLGNKEAKTKHPLMKTVAEKTEEVKNILEKENEVFFEWNEGNHFFEADKRLVKGIRFLLEQKNQLKEGR